MNTILDEMEKLTADVNVNEIADHLSDESLFNWCGAWREEMRELINELRRMHGNS